MSLVCKMTLVRLLFLAFTLQSLSDICGAETLVPLRVVTVPLQSAPVSSPQSIPPVGGSEGQSGNVETPLESIGTVSVGQGTKRALVSQGVVGRTNGDFKVTGFEAQLHFDSTKFGRMQKVQGAAFRKVSTPFTKGMAAASNAVAQGAASHMTDQIQAAPNHKRVLSFLKSILPLIRERLQAKRLQQLQSRWYATGQQSPQDSSAKSWYISVSPTDPLEVQIAKKQRAAAIFKQMAKMFLARSLALKREVAELSRRQEGDSNTTGDTGESGKKVQSAEETTKPISDSEASTGSENPDLRGTSVPTQTSGGESSSMAKFRKQWLLQHYGGHPADNES